MKPADIITVMLFNAVRASKEEDKPALVFVLGIMAEVVKELPGDNEALMRYIEQIILRFNTAKNS
jgi:hypothetical protein